MGILFDQGTPVPLRSELYGHEIETAYERGWSTLENGELLAVAEADGFEGLLTTDNNLQYQQNLSERRIAIMVLSTPSWPRIKQMANEIRERLESATTGTYTIIKIP